MSAARSFNKGGPRFTLSNSLLMNNRAIGGPGGDGGSGGVGGGLAINFGSVTIDNTGFFGNQAIGGAASQAGNQAGLGLGGGIQNFGTLALTNCTLVANQAQGGAGTEGATGGNGDGAPSRMRGPSPSRVPRSLATRPSAVPEVATVMAAESAPGFLSVPRRPSPTPWSRSTRPTVARAVARE